MTFQRIKGTFDILPESYTAGGTTFASSTAWQHVESVIREVLTRFGFREIRTPIIEPTELIARGVGGTTDIVQKEMFAFERGDTHYVLRPELTAPVVRAYLEHHLDQKGGTQKLFYIGPCFRAEQPQKGRFRQFHQFGTETIGTDSPAADAETIAAMMTIYRTLGITNTVLRINTLGEASERAAYREALRSFLDPVKDKLSETSRRRLETNPLRILDTKIPQEQELLIGAPTLEDFLGEESVAHYDEVKARLTSLGIDFVKDPRLVRGLDYYTRTAFELESPDLGAQSALAGGGRYDGLAEELGSGKRVPAIGFAAGMERLFLALEAADYTLPAAPNPAIFCIALGEAADRKVFRLVHDLRLAGIHVDMDHGGRSFKAQMREANRAGAAYVLILGDNELEQNIIILKNMETGEQESVAIASLGDHLRTLIPS